MAGFLLFRLFDITKPFPIRRLESSRAAWGSSPMTRCRRLCRACLISDGMVQSLLSMGIRKSSNGNRPEISQVTPPAAITGGELTDSGQEPFAGDRPHVTIGDVAAPDRDRIRFAGDRQGSGRRFGRRTGGQERTPGQPDLHLRYRDHDRREPASGDQPGGGLLRQSSTPRSAVRAGRRCR